MPRVRHPDEPELVLKIQHVRVVRLCPIVIIRGDPEHGKDRPPQRGLELS